MLIIEKYGYSGLILATVMALIKFIPWPVTSGFTTGIAVSIMATQAVDFLGIHAESAPPREFFHKLQWIWENLSRCHPVSLGLALACVLFIGFWPRLGIKRVPGSIVAMRLRRGQWRSSVRNRNWVWRPSARSSGLAPSRSGCRRFKCPTSAWNEFGL